MGYGVALNTTSIVHIRTNRSIYIVAQDRLAVKRPIIFAALDGPHLRDRAPRTSGLGHVLVFSLNGFFVG